MKRTTPTTAKKTLTAAKPKSKKAVSGKEVSFYKDSGNGFEFVAKSTPVSIPIKKETPAVEKGKEINVSLEQEPIHISEGTILTNDPSFTAWGWAILSWNGEVLKVGCIKTAPEQKKRRIRKSDDTSRRISDIVKIILGLISEYNVKYILSEAPHGSQNASAAVMIGACAAILQTIADTLQIGIEQYSEGDSKKNALGKLSASKGEMIEAIKKQYKVPWNGKKYHDEAVADAIAIHYVASKQSSTLRLFKKQ